MSTNTQKEYLKKYLSIGKDPAEKKKKKKKAKPNTVPSRLKIIDDNADTFEDAVKEDLLEDEDAPQIVAVIDERPPSLQIDEKSKTNLWIPIGSNNENSTESSTSTLKKMENNGDLSPPRFKAKLVLKRNQNRDMSPPRKKRSSDISPPRKKSSSDISPPRKKSYSDMSPPRKKSSSDISPPRKKSSSDISPPRKKSYSDMSPPRKKSSSDISPPRKKSYSDKHNSGKKRDDLIKDIKTEYDISPSRKEEMPPSVERLFYDENIKVSMIFQSFQSPTSLKRPESGADVFSPERVIKREENDSSPPRKMRKTLDGKTAGLQNAKQLAAETTLLKEREAEMFKKMTGDISRDNVSTIVRDKKTGRVRNLEEEAARELEKKQREDVSKEKYSRWGRGLKQVEDATKKREEELVEFNKPLARYANDEDLEKYLKEQEREGDPMLAYIRKKKKKKDVEEGKPIKPEYMGEFMPNRFGIRPGHRWDGVDRSNGYEKKWFEIQNSKMAQQEEAYKWSTEDM
ncbi:BUD13 homolog [Coccinella septempunctata]|uniref:BUD13 homolog n=1 Tax=Coccinella septempunctata TaxID=41139 RepID=UPI001D08902C|nr:BUD13 homolog [Coccinella septempunctata]